MEWNEKLFDIVVGVVEKEPLLIMIENIQVEIGFNVSCSIGLNTQVTDKFVLGICLHVYRNPLLVCLCVI